MLGDFEQTHMPSRASNIIQVTSEAEGGHTLYLGCYRRASDQAGDLLPSLVALVNQSAIGQLSEFAVHASVVAYGDRIVAFPALSGGGKTTLAAASVLAGAEYISDEALVLDDDGGVIPYPKPMALSSWSCEVLGLPGNDGETLVLPDGLGGKTHADTSALTDLVLAEYGHDSTILEPLARSQAMTSLISLSFNHYKDPERAFRIASEVARRVNVWKLAYDDPLEAARTVSTTVRG